MRTSVEINDDLLNAILAATGQPTAQAAVEEALRRVLLQHQREAGEMLAGVGWDGDLQAMQEDRGA